MEAGRGARTSFLSVIFAWAAFQTEKLTENPLWSNIISVLGVIATIVAIVSGFMAIRYYYFNTLSLRKDRKKKEPM